MKRVARAVVTPGCFPEVNAKPDTCANQRHGRRLIWPALALLLFLSACAVKPLKFSNLHFLIPQEQRGATPLTVYVVAIDDQQAGQWQAPAFQNWLEETVARDLSTHRALYGPGTTVVRAERKHEKNHLLIAVKDAGVRPVCLIDEAYFKKMDIFLLADEQGVRLIDQQSYQKRIVSKPADL